MLGDRTLALSMIVKDEAPVIGRALASALPYVDSWVIVDTGSTDGTQAIVRTALSGVSGELLEREWVDFATNRNQALEPALARADYVLSLDADEVLDAEPWFAPSGLDADSYVLSLREGAVRALTRRVVASRLPWRWVGVLHEYLDCPGARAQRLPGLTVAPGPGGARRRDPATHDRDLAVLRAAILAEPGNDRYRYFLAQTAHDAGYYAQAAGAWREFLIVATDREERYHALLHLARCLERTGRAWPEVQDAYMAAWAAEPRRAEPCAHLADHHYAAGAVALADVFLRHAYACPIPLAARLPVDLALHQIAIPVRYAHTCAALGRTDEALAVIARTLGTADLPPAIAAALLEQQAALAAALSRA